MNIFYGLLSVLIISLVSLVGAIFFFWRSEKISKMVLPLVGLAIGALFGDAFLHLIPEALENETFRGSTSLFILLGIILFFIFERFLLWHHHHDPSHAHESEKPLGKLILFSDALHNFLDGVIIAVSYAISVPVGVATTIAVVLHELPQEIGDFGLLIHSGYSRRKALLFNFFSSLTAVLGFVVGTFATLSEAFLSIASAFAAGSFIYIAGSDLVPELKSVKISKQSILEFVFIILGIGLMYLLLFLE